MSDRLRSLREYQQLAVHIHAPGVWTAGDGDHLSKLCRRDIYDDLKPALGHELAEATIETLDAWAVDYRLWKRRTNTEQGRAFRQWVRDSLGHIDKFQEWLARDPLPRKVVASYDGDLLQQLTAERESLLKRVAEFKEWIEDSHDPRRPAHKPPDWLRNDLIAYIGTTLALAGVPLKESDTGAFAKVLHHVLVDVGLESSQGPSLRQSIRAVIDDHATDPVWIEATSRAVS